MSQERGTELRHRFISNVDRATDTTANLIGQTFGVWFIDSLRRRTSQFDISISNIESLDSLASQPYILVSNHVRAKGLVVRGKDINITPDAFVLEKILEERTAVRPKIVASSDFGFEWGKNTTTQKVQAQIEKWRQAYLEGMGYITIKRKDGKVNLNLYRQIQKTLSHNVPVVMFPQGTSYDGQHSETEVKTGVARLAKKYDVKILPVHLQGATSWQPQTHINVDFRKPIDPSLHSVEELTQLVKLGISE